VVYKNAINALRRLKERFKLALVTTNAKEYIGKILEASGAKGLYDIISAIPVNEEPNHQKLTEKFVKENGKPAFYLAARSKDAIHSFSKLKVKCIYASWDGFDEEIAKLVSRTIRNPSELEASL
jgi:hypothetical protein